MPWIEFSEQPVWLNGLILVVGGLIVCVAGSKLAKAADKISSQTGLSRVLAGALLLGAATSLPEIVTTATAASLGNAPLAVNNLFGGVAMQLVVLAAIDFFVVRNAPLTFFSPAPVLLLSGVFLILLLALGVVGAAAGDVLLLGHIGCWPLILCVAYAASLFFMNRFAESETWTASRLPDNYHEDNQRAKAQPEEAKGDFSWRPFMVFGLNCLLVLVGGVAVSATADAIASQTGIGSGFIGATLVAVTTSLPEISTTAGAVRLGAYTMAISSIFGTNSLEVALLFVADIAYTPGAVMNAVDASALLLAGASIVLTAIYLWGLLERRDKCFLRMGVDSWLVIVAYFTAIGILYSISGVNG